MRRFYTALFALSALLLVFACQPTQEGSATWRIDPERGALTPSEWTSIPAFIVDYTAQDGTPLKAWVWKGWLPASPTLLYLHGPRGHLGYSAQYLRYIIEQGFPVIIPEYRGFGPNEGEPSLDAMIDDALGAYAMAQRQASLPSQIIVMSHSVGSLPASEVAKTYPNVFGMVPIAAMPSGSAQQVQQSDPLLEALKKLQDQNNGASAGQSKTTVINTSFTDVKAPKIFVHGRLDNVMDYAKAHLLYESSPGPSAFITLDDVGHRPSEFAIANLYPLMLQAFATRNMSLLKPLEASGTIHVEVKY
jgi:pimeloyl-ACP methyl ester carboxylesterase